MEVGRDVVGDGESNTVGLYTMIWAIEGSKIEEEESERTNVEVDVGFAGGASQARYMGIELSAVIIAQFS